KPTRRAPCAIRPPNRVRRANSSSTWIGEKSPVSPAKRATSGSPTVFVTRSTWPSGMAARAAAIGVTPRSATGAAGSGPSPVIVADPPAAVDVEHLARHVARQVRDEEQAPARHVVRLRQPAEGDLLDHRALPLGPGGQVRPGQRRHRDPGPDAVHGDAPRAPLER